MRFIDLNHTYVFIILGFYLFEYRKKIPSYRSLWIGINNKEILFHLTGNGLNYINRTYSTFKGLCTVFRVDKRQNDSTSKNPTSSYLTVRTSFFPTWHVYSQRQRKDPQSLYFICQFTSFVLYKWNHYVTDSIMNCTFFFRFLEIE